MDDDEEEEEDAGSDAGSLDTRPRRGLKGLPKHRAVKPQRRGRKRLKRRRRHSSDEEEDETEEEMGEDVFSDYYFFDRNSLLNASLSPQAQISSVT